MALRDGNIVLFREMPNNHRRKDSRHVMHSLLRKLQVPIRHGTVPPRRICMLFANQTADSAFTAVVRRHRQKPVAKFIMQFRKVSQSGFGRKLRIAAHIDPKIQFQTITDTRFRDKLPHAGSFRTAIGLDIKTRFHQGQINKVPGHVPLGKLCINQGIVCRLTRKRTRNKSTCRSRHVVNLLHDAIVKPDRQREPTGIHRIQKILNHADRGAIRHIFVIRIHAFDRHAIRGSRIRPLSRQIWIDIFQGLHDAKRHLHLVNRVLGTTKTALCRVVLFGHKQPKRFFEVMLGNRPFVVVYGLKSILVIHPGRP